MSSQIRKQSTIVSHPREGKIPIEVKDGYEQARHSGKALTIQDVTGTANDYSPQINWTAKIEEEDAEDISKD